MKKLRKSLSHVGGEARLSGDAALHALLLRAATPPGEGRDAAGGGATAGLERSLTHGFHPWPGRLHPHTARTLIRAAPPGLIADPFMGAGTVPVEAMLAGRAALGNDLNPIGVEVAWVRTRRFSPGALTALTARVKALVKKAEGLVAGGAMAPAVRDEAGRLARWFDEPALAQVLALARCLREGDAAWQGSPHDPLTRVLAMALSSVLVKASRQVSDSVVKLDRRELEVTPAGRVGHWLKKRVSELALQLAAFREAVALAGEGVAEPLLWLGDARTPPARPPIAAIVSSPPYPGVYDYSAHHQLRCLVLGLPLGEATAREIGSRRASERLGKETAHARYVDDLGRVLATWSETLAPGGFVALVIGDGQIGSEVVRVLPLLTRAAASAGLTLRATLSQARPTFGAAAGSPPDASAPAAGKVPKDEHLVWLERAERVDRR